VPLDRGRPGGAFTPEDDLIANFFPMHNMTEAAGFGGLRRYRRGAGPAFQSSGYQPILGVTDLEGAYVHPAAPTSFGIYVGNYAGEPSCSPMAVC